MIPSCYPTCFPIKPVTHYVGSHDDRSGLRRFELYMLLARFGVDGDRLTLKELGRRIPSGVHGGRGGVSAERARQKLALALVKLETAAHPYWLFVGGHSSDEEIVATCPDCRTFLYDAWLRSTPIV